MTTQCICLIDFIGASSAEHQRNTRVSYHVTQGPPFMEILLAISQRPIEKDAQMMKQRRKKGKENQLWGLGLLNLLRDYAHSMQKERLKGCVER